MCLMEGLLTSFYILQDSNLSFLKQIFAIILKNPISKFYKTTRNLFKNKIIKPKC